MQNQIIVYNNGELELKVSVKNETIWLTQKQIALLFEKDLRTVNEHIKAIYKEEELLEEATIRKFRIVQKEVYHIGASLKDLGKKWFAFSKMDVASVGILERLEGE